MKRQRRNRAPRRRGLHHIGELLSIIVDELDHEPSRETCPAGNIPSSGLASNPPTVTTPAGQTTFAFYQTAGV